MVKSIDRLGRNYTEILEQWRTINQELNVSIVVLDMPLLNTQEDKELIWKLVTDLVLQIFSYVAKTERENIRSRQAEGIAAAKARGVRFGRPRIPMPENFGEMVELWRRQKISASEAARRLGVSCHTFLRRVRELFSKEDAGKQIEPSPEAHQAETTSNEKANCVPVGSQTQPDGECPDRKAGFNHPGKERRHGAPHSPAARDVPWPRTHRRRRR